MKAIVKEKPGIGFTIKEVPVPEELAANEVLVKVKRASICGTDLHIYEWNNWAQQKIRPPQVAGHEFTGEVIKVGPGVTRVSVGDIVVAETHIPCQKCLQCRTGRMHICKDMEILGVDRDGVFASYVRVPEVVLWKVPEGISPEFASIMEPFGNAVHTALVTDLTGKNVLITGAGPIGVMAAAIAKSAGAAKVIVTELKAFRKQLAKKMGADIVLDPREVNVEKEVKRLTDGNGVDFFMEMSGNLNAFKDGLKCTTNGGEVSLLGVFPGEIDIDINSLVIFKGLTLYGITGRRMFETWQIATELLKNKRVDLTPVVTHVLKMEDWEKGIESMLKGEAGKVVLEIE
ncbi:L-threonine 3-dehydrogenase [Kosmotoga pacifica]|uniref:L-threonine 3-dehydrogenase n=1 Tax=Kosmotoga pacifica TaxID=1330330 RepID=A0A0G2ZF67_9BACT|nr:L-threonine 3-dehydrogenase [Kosmotoga pacifica]